MRVDGEFFKDWGAPPLICSIIGGAPGGMGGPGKNNPNSSENKGGGTGQGGMGGGSYNKPAGPGASIAASKTPGGITGNKPTGQTGSGGGTFQGGTGTTRDQMQEQDQIGANVASAQNDYNNQGNGLADTIGNFLAGMFGFNEIDPTQPGYSGPGRPGQTGQADWGFDPAGLVGGTLGNAFGVPIVGGFLADQLSSALGRPLEVNLGPSVFGDPMTGETTVTGPNMSVRDRDSGEYFGAPPTLAGLGNGVSNVAPRKSTLYGTDGSAPETPAEPQAPTAELPDGLSPINPPSGVNVDAGNTNLDPGQLASIFQQYGSKVYRGKNKSAVVS